MTQQPLPLEPRSAFSRFFARVQDALWYRDFLLPVVTTLADLPAGSRVLDVGTGPGRLLALLRQDMKLECVGVDSDSAMLYEARRRQELVDVPLVHVPAGHILPFPPHTFDAICFCSVLYLLGLEEVNTLLQQAQTLLRPRGRIVILTPSGADDLRFTSAWRHWTFHLWRRLTAPAGRQRHGLHPARDFAAQLGVSYASHSVFSGMAVVEVISAP